MSDTISRDCARRQRQDDGLSTFQGTLQLSGGAGCAM